MLRYDILKPQDDWHCTAKVSGVFPPLFTGWFGVFSFNLNFKTTEGLPAKQFWQSYSRLCLNVRVFFHHIHRKRPCSWDLVNWNLCNMLKCNPSKTEIIHFSSRFSPPEPIASIKVGHHNVQPTSHAWFTPYFCSSCQQHLSRSFAFVSFHWQNQKISFASGYWAHCPCLRFIKIGLL